MYLCCDVLRSDEVVVELGLSASLHSVVEGSLLSDELDGGGSTSSPNLSGGSHLDEGKLG